MIFRNSARSNHHPPRTLLCAASDVLLFEQLFEGYLTLTGMMQIMFSYSAGDNHCFPVFKV